MTGYHLAQFNTARAVAPMDDPVLADFMARLDEINALAEESPGFVWRLQGESGNATGIQAYDDPRVLINMSVWDSVESLFDYVYRSGHSKVMARRRESKTARENETGSSSSGRGNASQSSSAAAAKRSPRRTRLTARVRP